MAGLQGPNSGFAVPRSADVAHLAGLSRKTVSRAFNDGPYVSAEVRQRVVEAAEVLGYRLANATRTPASGRTPAIGVVTLGTAGYEVASPHGKTRTHLPPASGPLVELVGRASTAPPPLRTIR